MTGEMLSGEIEIRIRIVPDMEGWRRYIAQYPAFEGETLEETLRREAVGTWISEGLVATGLTPDRAYFAEERT